MRTLIITSLFIGGLFGMNSLPKQAKEQFANGKYTESVRLFDEAIELYPGQRATLEFNIGQIWLIQDSTQRAINWYSRAANNKLDGFISSLAHNNLGVLWNQEQPTSSPVDPSMQQGAAAQAGDPLQAELDKVNRSLEAFKNALRRHTENDFARYNYELLKRKQQQLQQQQQQQQNQDQQQEKQEQQKEQKDNNQQQKSQKQQKSPQNTEGKGMEGQQQQVSMEEARQLLEAMKDNEKRFLQQLQKSKKHRPNRQDGPDW